MRPGQAHTLKLLLAGGARPSRGKRRNGPEQQLQRAVCHHLRLCGVPGLVWFHVPNGGKRNKIEGAIFKGLGVKAGVSDLILLHEGRCFALELKAKSGMKLTKAQVEFQQSFRAAGGYATWATSIDEALTMLGGWGLLRTQRQAA